jgi:hypothetical protein
MTLGLTSYSARAYAALARSWRAPAGVVADGSGVPRQRIYDVLEDLVNRGLVTRIEGKPSLYQSVDPAEALARLLEGCRHVLIEQEQVASELSVSMRPAWLQASRGADGKQPSGRVSLADAGHWCDLAKHSVVATSRPPYEGLADPSWIRHVKRLTGAGGTVRCIYQTDILGRPDLLANVRRFCRAGEQARVVASVRTRMILADGTSAMLPMPTPGGGLSDSLLLIEHGDVVTRLKEDFERMWSVASPVQGA